MWSVFIYVYNAYVLYILKTPFMLIISGKSMKGIPVITDNIITNPQRPKGFFSRGFVLLQNQRKIITISSVIKKCELLSQISFQTLQLSKIFF